jgi:hypothetical protein
MKGTKYNRMFFQLQVSTHHTNDTEFGLLPTPKTVDNHSQRPLTNGQNISKTTGTKYGINLVQMAEAGLLPTPSAYDWNTAQRQEKYKERQQLQKEKGVNLHYPLKQMVMDINPNGKTSQLSPQFVMEMMGFPTDWTLLPFLNGEQNQSKQEETQ